MVLVLSKGASKKDIEQINKKLLQLPSRKMLDAKKYCGVIKLKEDPLAIQKKMRDEWELDTNIIAGGRRNDFRIFTR